LFFSFFFFKLEHLIFNLSTSIIMDTIIWLHHLLCANPIPYTLRAMISTLRFSQNQTRAFSGMSKVSGLVIGFGIRTALWLQRSREAIREEDNRTIWIEYYVFFISDFFHV
jgi:hypothetical protein